MPEGTTDAAPKEATDGEGLLKPISPDQPAGQDPKLTDDFDRVFGEVGKLEMLSGGEPDWAMVQDTSAKIIDTVGKDLRCLGWWVIARFRLKGLAGLKTGLAAVAACVATFKEGIHPKRDKARAAALDWLGTRLEIDLPAHLKSAPAEDIEAMRKNLDAMQSSLEGLCASFEGLQRGRSALKAVKVEVPKPAAGAKPAAAPAAKPAAAAAAPLPPAAPVIPEGLEDLIEQLMDRAAGIAAGGESPISLRMRRQALWLGTPELLAGGKKYDCESVQPKLRMELEQMFGGKRWAELLERTEALFRDHPWCLDLTFWSAHAAGEIVGPAARDALAGELVALMIRAPKLPKSTDRNGQPLASAPTRSFISSLMAAPAGAAAPAPAAAPAAETAAGAAPAGAAPVVALVLEALPADVEALLSEKKLADAVRRASAASAGLSGRAAFCRNLVLAERLEGPGGSPALAYSLFRALMSRMRTASLSQWEPALEARCIRGYLQGARATKQAVENERELLDALMLLDPGAAVGLV